MRPSRNGAAGTSTRRIAVRLLPALAVAFVLVFTMVQAASGENSIILRAQFPIEGERTELYIQDDTGGPVPGASVRATYRPGSSVEEISEIGITGKSGRVNWTPAIAGIVTLAATWSTAAGDTVTASANVSVKFRSTPAGGILIMLLAGLLLVGGSAVRILRVLRSGE